MKDSGMFNMMYTNALHGLENGCLMPWDKDILASNPLPASVIEPYTTKEVPDVLESMNITFSAMAVWIDEAKKVNYFSKRFVQLSKMVMNGVTTMGRGLITLHARGESLEQAPMSISDLIGVASYHFRKSYLGVLQTSRSHPELGEKLLMNQIGWCNMLMRLFKTRDKLAVSGQCSLGRIEEPGTNEDHGARITRPENEEGRMKKEELSSGSVLPSNSGITAGTMGLPAASEQAFGAPSAFAEPGAFSEPRAFSSYDPKKTEKIRNGSEIRNKKSEIRNEAKDEGAAGAREAEITATENEVKGEEKQQIKENEAEQVIKERGTVNGEELQIRENDQDPEEGCSPIKEEPRTGELCSSGKNGDSPVKGQSPEDMSPDDQLLESGLPAYLKILQRVYARSEPSDNGELTFGFDELCYLAADPEFNRIYPDQASQMRSILRKLDSS